MNNGRLINIVVLFFLENIFGEIPGLKKKFFFCIFFFFFFFCLQAGQRYLFHDTRHLLRVLTLLIVSILYRWIPDGFTFFCFFKDDTHTLLVTNNAMNKYNNPRIRSILLAFLILYIDWYTQQT